MATQDKAMDLHSIEVDLVCFDKLRAILRSRQQGSSQYSVREVLETLEACKLEYEKAFIEYGDRLSKTDQQLLLAELDSLKESIRVESEPEVASADSGAPALEQERTISSSHEASCIDVPDHDRNADNESKADERPEHPVVETVGVVDVGVGEEGKDSNSLTALDGIQAEGVGPALR
ncbi:hypothetical protein CB0940_03487 [Cercospora beticola]|uniref:Uncharacterized protein n=1 Tax=Cercospora beticola TaxID=122368 RepID=A0A2G5I1P5_CERBT|nr:hypothetical protein CB0940_03487 [Cercospora beticola]PIA98716.1 hypothetical protein CB0940_03487 [Cercospora beticola]WPB00661.1 hypothetical protein RHO25_005281 [Cercospora beticola]CAK1361103.1 unnamed protein product [Cercospora beticola]